MKISFNIEILRIVLLNNKLGLIRWPQNFISVLTHRHLIHRALRTWRYHESDRFLRFLYLRVQFPSIVLFSLLLDCCPPWCLQNKKKTWIRGKTRTVSTVVFEKIVKYSVQLLILIHLRLYNKNMRFETTRALLTIKHIT